MSKTVPCAYREHTTHDIAVYLRHGLSLCIQGTCTTQVCTSQVCRFIPVHTGNIAEPSMILSASSVYPCAYREHILSVEQRSLIDGLSLCIQGTSQPQSYLCPACRFIPVHTGNMGQGDNRFANSPVYPCAYREHELLKLLNVSQLRFIPVHTGNMYANIANDFVITVYPCAYREHRRSKYGFNAVFGLSLCIQGTYQL